VQPAPPRGEEAALLRFARLEGLAKLCAAGRRAKFAGGRKHPYLTIVGGLPQRKDPF